MKPFDNESPVIMPVRVLAQSAVASSIYAAAGWLAAPLTDMILASFTIPAGLMGLNGAVRVRAIYSLTNSSATKNVRIAFGSVDMANLNFTANGSTALLKTITNRNAANSQVFFSPSNSQSDFSGSSVAAYTAAVNTANDTVVALRGTTALETGITLAATADISGNGATVTVNKTAHGFNTGEYVKASLSSTSGYNADPVMITRISANQFTYAAAGTGTPATAPTFQRYSTVVLEAYSIELLPGAN